MRPLDNWNPDDVFVDGKYISPDTWYDGAGTPFQPQIHYFVGGATKMYGAALLASSGRLPPVSRAVRDFAERGRPAREHLHPVRVVRRVPVHGAR